MKQNKTLILLLTSLFAIGCGPTNESSKNESLSSSIQSNSLIESESSKESSSINSSDSSSSSITNSSNNNSSSESSTSSEKNNQTYKIVFKDGDTIIYEEEAESGDFVDIPDDLVNSDPRYIFKGWEGIDEYDYNQGKVEVFEDDQVYTAIWYEMFGTTNEFSATKVNSEHEIILDGEMDIAYNDTACNIVSTVTKGNSDNSAQVYFMWDESYFYVFVDVKDSNVITRDNSYNGTQWTEHNDAFEIWIDLLHDDSLASNGYTDGWGGSYRGEPGPMCEAHFKINPGFIPSESNRFGDGSEACWDGWWSNEAKNDGDTAGYSKITDTGYTVEYKIKATNSNIPDYLKLGKRDQIGVGIKIYDKDIEDDSSASKDNEAPNAIAMEAINGNMSGPKKLSNINVVSNPYENKTVYGVKEVRDCFEVKVDNEEDLLYTRDADVINLGNSTLKMLWGGTKVYILASLSSNSEYLKLNSSLLNEEVTLTSGVNEITLNSSSALMLGNRIDLSVEYKENDLDIISDEWILKLIENNNNRSVARKITDAKKLGSEETITVDGIKDEAFNNTGEIDISTVVLNENGASVEDVTTRGKAYIRWDDSNIYVFVDVTDSDVSTTIGGNRECNDSVEFYLSTCRSLPLASTGWGDYNRPYQSYCGEGLWYLYPTQEEVTQGSHWMYDWKDGVPREVKSILTETGYTAEYKIAWSAFAGLEKEGEIIDFMININNGHNGTRTGIISTNEGGNYAWSNPYVLDHLRLVA